MDDSASQKVVLVTLGKAGKPLTPKEIAAETGLRFSSSMAHLQALVKAGHVSTPKRGFYEITDYGQERIGADKPEGRHALAILSPVSSEKAFRFYRGMDNYLGIYATSLSDFCEKIRAIDLSSIRFHLFRKDFESWIREELGDPELANSIGSIRTSDLSGETIRERLRETVESRCRQLEELSP